MATPGSQGTPAAAPGWGRAPVQHAAVVVGAIFLLVGALGFVPGVTARSDTLTFAGHRSEAALFGVFAVSGLHNAVHLLFGVLGPALSSTFNGARAYLVGGGVVYAALGVYGILVYRDSSANVLPVNTADNWLHLGLAVVMVGSGLILGRTSRRGSPERA
jgi:uncharacterized protein DUF4383